jgi:hypothetical protein
MTFHAVILSMIATALLACSLSLVGDAIVYLKHLHRRLRPRRVAVAVAEYPHPIANEYPVERSISASMAPVNRTPGARRQWRVSGSSMSEMQQVLGRDSRRASAAR